MFINGLEGTEVEKGAVIRDKIREMAGGRSCMTL